MNPRIEQAIKEAEKRDANYRDRFLCKICDKFGDSNIPEPRKTVVIDYNKRYAPVVTDEEFERLKELYPMEFASIASSGVRPEETYLKTIKNCLLFFVWLTVIGLIAWIIMMAIM